MGVGSCFPGFKNFGQICKNESCYFQSGTDQVSPRRSHFPPFPLFFLLPVLPWTSSYHTTYNVKSEINKQLTDSQEQEEPIEILYSCHKCQTGQEKNRQRFKMNTVC